MSSTAWAEEVDYWFAKVYKGSSHIVHMNHLGGPVERRTSSSRPSRNRAARSGASGYSAASSDGSDTWPARNRSRNRGVQVASLGDAYIPSPALRGSAGGGGGVNWVANGGCLNAALRAVIQQVAANFGSVRVSSTCRSHSQNARAGGAPRSMHLTGDAADFRVFGNVSAVHSFLRSHGSVGGLKHYGGGLFHIDTGARRPM